MNDIVRQLRAAAETSGPELWEHQRDMMREAADEIERLRALAGHVDNGEVTFKSIKAAAKASPPYINADTYDMLSGTKPNG